MIDLIIYSLVTWRMSSLLVRERGLFAVFERIREWAGVYPQTDFEKDEFGHITKHEQQKADNELGQLFLCLWCMSFWVGLVIAKGNFLNALVYSAGAIVIEGLVND